LLDHRDSEHYFKSFYIRRGCRILPAYLLSLASFVVFRWLLANSHSSHGWQYEVFLEGGMPLWANLTFTQNILGPIAHHYNPDWLVVNWSLVIEEQFYLILPLAIWLFRPATVVKISLVLICLAPAVELWLCIFKPMAYPAVSGMIPLRGGGLLVGVLCAYALRQDRLRTWIEQNTSQLSVMFIVLLAGDVFIEANYSRNTFEYERILFFNTWIDLFYSFLLLLTIIEKNGFIAPLMRFPPLRKLGVISYSVYLFHKPINDLLHGLLLGKDWKYQQTTDVLVTLLALLLTLSFARVSWRFLEKPIVKWGHSVKYGQPKSKAPRGE
ncbi:MAG TPA: acyltransferase, partial [Candidatus Acidoferrales bacterium]|nr:acyltransferase [Candidatus Acidoferrales bacterium]